MSKISSALVWQTSNKTTVYFVENKSLPMLDINIVFNAGSSRDPENKSGLSNLVSEIFATQTTRFNENEIIDKVADLGMSISSQSSKDLSTIGLRCLSDKKIMLDSINLLGHCLKDIKFDNEVIERMKSQLQVKLDYDKQSPAKIASKKFIGTLFGDHQYAKSNTGNSDSISSINTDDIKSFYQKFYTNKNAKIIIVGDVRKDQAETIAETISSSLSSCNDIYLPIKNPEINATAIKDHKKFESKQTTILFGHQSVAKGDPLYFPLTVGNHILGGGGLNSRLFNDIRKKKGLVYSIYSGLQTYSRAGIFVINAQTAYPDETLKSIDSIYSKFISNAVSDKELNASKDYLCGSYVLDCVKNSDQLDLLTMIAMYDLPLNYIDIYLDKIKNITVNDIRSAYQQINKNLPVTVTVGP